MDAPLHELNAGERQIVEWFSTLSNWGRWGEDDQLGALNLIDDAARLRGAASVRHGVPVSCAWDLKTGHALGDLFPSFQRYMIAGGEGRHDADRVMKMQSPFGAALEFVGMVFHGRNVTHLDALSHCFWDGKMYNGRPSALVSSFLGATSHAVTTAANGITSRGVLLDVAAARGVEWLDPGEAIMPEDLDAAEKRQGVTVQSGDVLLVYSGFSKRKRAIADPGVDTSSDPCCGDPRGPAPHAAVTPWLHERGVALFGSDTGNDLEHGELHPYLWMPFHTITLVFMGLWLLDNCDLAPLAAKCEELGKWDFLFSAPPLRMDGATGSPVNPIALL